MTYASQQLKTLFEFVSSRSTWAKGVLDKYNTEGAPTLRVGRAKLPRGATKEELGRFKPTDLKLTGAPTLSDENAVKAARAKGTLYISGTFTDAALDLDTSLILSMSTNGRSLDEQRTIEAALEELAHASQAIDDTARYGNLVESEAAVPYEKRTLEVDAKALTQKPDETGGQNQRNRRTRRGDTVVSPVLRETTYNLGNSVKRLPGHRFDGNPDGGSRETDERP